MNLSWFVVPLKVEQINVNLFLLLLVKQTISLIFQSLRYPAEAQTIQILL